MAKKGGFTDDNIMDCFISKKPRTTEPEQEQKPEQPPEGYKLDPKYVEKKTKRVQIVVQPSLYKLMKERADREGLSLNEFIHSTMAAAVKE